jgi:hypothetical protein
MWYVAAGWSIVVAIAGLRVTSCIALLSGFWVMKTITASRYRAKGWTVAPR